MKISIDNIDEEDHDDAQDEDIKDNSYKQKVETSTCSKEPRPLARRLGDTQFECFRTKDNTKKADEESLGQN